MSNYYVIYNGINHVVINEVTLGGLNNKTLMSHAVKTKEPTTVEVKAGPYKNYDEAEKACNKLNA